MNEELYKIHYINQINGIIIWRMNLNYTVAFISGVFFLQDKNSASFTEMSVLFGQHEAVFVSCGNTISCVSLPRDTSLSKWAWL